MSVPPTNAEADAASPASGPSRPNRSLLNQFLRDVISTLTGKSDSGHGHTTTAITGFDSAVDARITVQKAAVNGLATLDGTGRVPTAQLPSFVDDVLEFANLAAFPVTGEQGKIYTALDSNATYRWSGSAYVQIGGPGATISFSSQAEAEAGVENTKVSTSLRVAQAIAVRAKDALLTGWVIGSNAVVAATDSISQAIGKLQARVDTKADFLSKVTEAGTAFNITAAGHANRDVETTNAAAVAATFVFTGMADGDEGVIYQRGTGVVTLQAGPAYSFAAGVSLLTTAGQGSWISWRYLGGTSVLITARAQAAAGGGSSNVTSYRVIGNFAAPLAAGLSSDLTTLNIQPLTADGDIVHVLTRIGAGNEAAEQSFPSLWLNGVQMSGGTLDSNNRAFDIRTTIERVSDTTVRIWGNNFGNPYVGPDNSPYTIATVSSLTAGATLSVRLQRPALQTKTVTFHRLSATVERA